MDANSNLEENATRYKALFEEFIEYINEYARANDRYRRALQPYEAELRQAQRIRPTNQIEAMNRSIEISTRQAQLSQAAREAAVPRDEDFEELAGEIDPMYIILTSSENDLAAIEDYMTE